MPNLSEYPGISQIQNESPDLPYGSLNLSHTKDIVSKVNFSHLLWLIFNIFGRKVLEHF